MGIKIDFTQLEDALKDGVGDILNGVLDDVADDLEGPVREIASRLSIAVRRNRADLVEESRDQLLLIIEERQLRVREGAQGLLQDILGLGLEALVTGAAGGVRSLRIA